MEDGDQLEKGDQVLELHFDNKNCLRSAPLPFGSATRYQNDSCRAE